MAGGFTGLLYITSIVAGYLADHYIGYYRAVLLGACLLFFGYVFLAFVSSLFLLCFSLGIISVGTGLLKSNISSYLGTSYKPKDPRREKGFTIFYAGINIGSMLGNFTSGYFYKHYGSTESFLIAAMGILIGLLVFYIGFKRANLKVIKRSIVFKDWLLTAVLVISSIIIATWVIFVPRLSLIFFSIVTIGSVFLIIHYSKHSAQQMKRSMAYLIFLVIAIVFWSIYNQMFLSMNLFINRVVVHNFFGIPMTTQAFIIANNVGVIVFGFSIIKLWNYVSDAKKYLLGMFILCFVFVIVLLGIHSSSPTGKVSAYWVILAYLVLSLSEICISPIGLALATKLAPKGRVGIFMGLWLVTTGIGGYIAGLIARFAAVPKSSDTSIQHMKMIYAHAFQDYVILAVVAFILTLIATIFIKRLIE